MNQQREKKKKEHKAVHSLVCKLISGAAAPLDITGLVAVEIGCGETEVCRNDALFALPQRFIDTLGVRHVR